MAHNHDAAYELAYEEAVRGLSQQQSALDNFRTRDRDLALHMEDSYDENERRLQQLITLRWGSVVPAAEVIAWVVAIAIRS
jgi:hypothetical protein